MGTNPTRLASNLSAAVVAGIAAWSSYHHMVSVALSVGERPDVAYVLPLSVDGMLVVASVAMVDDRRNGLKVRWSARLAFVAGVTASVAANVAAAQPTVGARIVAAWPAVALLLTVELLSRTGRLLTRNRAGAPAAAPVVPVAVPAPVAPVAVAAPVPPQARPVSAPPIGVNGYAAEAHAYGPERSYMEETVPPRRAAAPMPEPVDPYPTPVSPAVPASTPLPPANVPSTTVPSATLPSTTLPSSTRIAVAQALPPAGPTATRQASERRARAAAQPTAAPRTSARVSSARPSRAADRTDAAD